MNPLTAPLPAYDEPAPIFARLAWERTPGFAAAPVLPDHERVWVRRDVAHRLVPGELVTVCGIELDESDSATRPVGEFIGLFCVDGCFGGAA